MKLKFAIMTLGMLALQGCATAPRSAEDAQNKADYQASLPSPRACKAKSLVFIKDVNGKGFCVTEAQAKCQRSSLFVLGDSDCLNTLMWKDDNARPQPLPQGTTGNPGKK
ncbi:hypothetical protein PQU92_16740 [Asticcacaulis sp. BYS171W]|uniref:Hemolysin n=1 Tax=Asticcacaulis aquaticus TaxID=2984212 RepID=A0ABT5HY30_9CAUL|nr:hypothetical protein [Asticcacaulis aquaticus]MDC7684933.1 hypothetical protein [Asticcacaulis aquaticus]